MVIGGRNGSNFRSNLFQMCSVEVRVDRIFLKISRGALDSLESDINEFCGLRSKIDGVMSLLRKEMSPKMSPNQKKISKWLQKGLRSTNFSKNW